MLRSARAGIPLLGQMRDDLLPLAERISQEDGDLAAPECSVDEFVDARQGFGPAGQSVARVAEGGLEDEHVAGNDLGGLGGERGAQAEIAGVEDSPPLALHQELSRAADVTGGMKRQLQCAQVEGLAIGCRERSGSLFQFRSHQGSSDGGGDDLLVGRDVIRVGVRNERQRPWPLGVQEQRALRDAHPRRCELDLSPQGSRHEQGFTIGGRGRQTGGSRISAAAAPERSPRSFAKASSRSGRQPIRTPLRDHRRDWRPPLLPVAGRGS